MRAVILAVFVFASGACSAARAEGKIELDLATEEGFPAIEAQKWLSTLTELGFAGLKIRAGRAGDKTKIVAEKRGGGTLYKVAGVLTARNELMLPGGRFSVRDVGRIAAWAERLREEGSDAGTAKTEKPFGLDDADFKSVHKDLGRGVGFSTKGKTAAEVVAKIGGGLAGPLELSRQAGAALEACDPVTEELQDLSCGAALAYVLRSAGLALIPQSAGKGQIGYSILRPAEKQKGWPVGLPADEESNKLVPKLLEFLNLEIDEIPLPQVLEALGERLETPILLDHIALVTRKIDPEKVVVSMPAKRTAYSLALRQLLSKARLKWTLRVDDAGKPFIWISTMVPVE